MKIITIVGARPQFIKAAVVSRAIANFNKDVTSSSLLITEVIVHTGQHYDRNMSDVFFEEMNIPRPNYFLDINGLSHGAMTGQMLEKIETVLVKEKPDMVVMATKGRTAHFHFGSIAEKIVKNSDVPVVAIPMNPN